MERKSQSKWDEQNLRTVTAKLTLREYALFKSECNAEGCTPYRVVLRLVKGWMKDHAATHDENGYPLDWLA